jgi:hypothetical protein
MHDTMTRYLEGVDSFQTRRALRAIHKPLIDRYSSQALTSAALVINGAGATFAKIGAAPFYAVAAGSLVMLAAGAAMPALTNVLIPAGSYNVAAFYVNSAGVITAAPGTASLTLGGVVFPQAVVGAALVGFLIITYAGAFVGGTTPLDTATTVYISPTGPIDPTCRV